MDDYSLMPVDHQPDFENVTLVPVDHDPFSDDGAPQPVQAQLAQTSRGPVRPEPQGQPSGVNGPATDSGFGGSSGGNAGGDPGNPPSEQGEAEARPFGGFANPTPTESLVNQAKMQDQRKIIEADPTGGHGFAYDEEANADEPSAFVTTNKAMAHYLVEGQTGQVFTQISPFYVKEGSRFAIIDASPERPATVTIHQNGKFTISRP